jgi:hypothetical protein
VNVGQLPVGASGEQRYSAQLREISGHVGRTMPRHGCQPVASRLLAGEH